MNPGPGLYLAGAGVARTWPSRRQRLCGASSPSCAVLRARRCGGRFWRARAAWRFPEAPGWPCLFSARRAASSASVVAIPLGELSPRRGRVRRVRDLLVPRRPVRRRDPQPSWLRSAARWAADDRRPARARSSKSFFLAASSAAVWPIPSDVGVLLLRVFTWKSR